MVHVSQLLSYLCAHVINATVLLAKKTLQAQACPLAFFSEEPKKDDDSAGRLPFPF